MKMSIRCKFCGKDVGFEMTDEQYETFLEWDSKDRWEREPIQNALSFLNADIREMFLSGICPTCWDDMFNGEDEEED